ncbi:MAG: peptidoglycan endopeptidase [Firmicutes bacterium]|nr:peptidoglycan endopeptidase [Bacillota bacterium]
MNQNDIERKIKSLIPKFEKVKFVHNGRSFEEGIDCLGFVILFYREFGIEIPNDDGEFIPEDWYKTDPERYISAIKQFSNKQVSINELQPLDLAYFAISRNIITHTGIMISQDRFVHMSPKSGFLISKLERHWKRRFKGAIRVIQ